MEILKSYFCHWILRFRTRKNDDIEVMNEFYASPEYKHVRKKTNSEEEEEDGVVIFFKRCNSYPY